ncbi:MAG TPA: hypothetical protein VIK33_04160 [Anaerolineae bacterium]
MSLVTYEGLVDNGQIRLRGNPRLPDGTRLIVIVTERPAWESRSMTEDEWRKPFDIFIQAVQSAAPAPLEDQPLTDAEINASVHATRKERRAQSAR